MIALDFLYSCKRLQRRRELSSAASRGVISFAVKLYWRLLYRSLKTATALRGAPRGPFQFSFQSKWILLVESGSARLVDLRRGFRRVYSFIGFVCSCFP